VHHVAWASTPKEHEPWRERVAAAGAHVTPIIDRFYFKSIYFREPSGVLFEIATIGPGFATDEPIEHLGERLSLPPDFEHLRSRSSRPDAATEPARDRRRAVSGLDSLAYRLRPAAAKASLAMPPKRSPDLLGRPLNPGL